MGRVVAEVLRRLAEMLAGNQDQFRGVRQIRRRVARERADIGRDRRPAGRHRRSQMFLPGQHESHAGHVRFGIHRHRWRQSFLRKRIAHHGRVPAGREAGVRVGGPDRLDGQINRMGQVVPERRGHDHGGQPNEPRQSLLRARV